jgi:uncharacterized membrane-anchored protein
VPLLAELRAGLRQPVAAKVPEITAIFWVIKILTTGMGEATSDWLAGVNIALAGFVGLVGLVIALWLQLRTERYEAPVYWFAVVMVAVFGTMAADGPHKILGVPYTVSSTFYALAVAVVLTVWYRSEGTLSIHSIVTQRREMFYWITVLATFALGTAAGDLTAFVFHWGYFASGVFFAVAIVLPGLAWWKLGLNGVVAFWAAYVLTRPLGASFADWLGKPHSKAGGVGWGDGTVAALVTVLIVALVAYVAKTLSDVQSPDRAGLDDRDLVPNPAS